MKGSILRSLGLLAPLLVVTLDQPTVDGCGVTIHNEVAFRASRILLTQDHPLPSFACPCPQAHLGQHSIPCPHVPSIARPGNEKIIKSQSKALDDLAPLLARKDLLFAGSFFPDWGYNCIGKIWNDAAEKAHWPPFVEASVKYILETYPQPWTDHVKELITFLFGVVSHSMGDLSWHALRGLDAGFIKVLSQTSFGGDYSKGHTLADLGAEFVLSHMSNMNHLITRWKVPVKDITEIYKRIGHRVPGPILSHCMRTGFAAAQANAILGSRLFPVYASKSPFLVEQVINYPMGGLRDMAEWSIDCWNGLAQYLNQERLLPGSDPKANATFNMCYALWEDREKQNQKGAEQGIHEDQVRQHHRGRSTEHFSGLSRLSLAGMQVQSKVDEDTGMVTFYVEEANQAEHGKEEERENTVSSVLDEDLEEATWDQKFALEEDSFYRISNSEMQSRFTPRSTPSENTTPQSSWLGSNLCLAFKQGIENHTRTIFLPKEYASFGHAVATGDFNGDGMVDFAVAAPHFMLDTMVPSQGAVFIVPSQALYAAQNGELGVDVRSIASRTLYGDPDEPQSRFGWSMAVVDLNQDGIDDLAIGAPGRGAKSLKYDGSVFVYFGNKDSGLSLEPDLVIYHDRAKDEGLGTPAGMETLAGLGYKLEGLDLTGSGFKDLLIGMPMATTHGNTTEDPQASLKVQAGKITVFLSNAMHSGHKLDSDHDWVIEGEDGFGWFGASFAVIAQGSHGPIPPSSMLSWFDWSASERAPQSMQGSIKQRILVVASPTFGSGEEAMRGKIQGYVIPDFSQQPSEDSNITRPAPRRIFTIHGDNKFGQLGSSLASYTIESTAAPRLTPQFPSGVPIQLLVIGSRSENIKNRLPRLGHQWQAGMVRVLDISLLPDGTDVKISELDDTPGVVRDSLRGSQSMAHLSAAMEVSTNGKTLWLTEPYAKGEAGRILEWEPDFELRANGEDRRGGKARRRRMWIKDDLAGVRGRRIVHDDDGEDGDDEDHYPGVKQCFFGADHRGRFGSQLLVEDLNGDGHDDVVVTSSHASQYATMAGIVTIKFRF
ncbi:Glycosylphosphatidylinositol specific phospholipase D1 [Mortierella sp. GBA43]|nr:Glycosylphosphatidylinositol specific phospholipase D1 [Mortierella sp. GBA43]